MKYSFVAAALVATVSAQSLSDIPSCALPCIDAARTSTTTCAADDYVCICDNITPLTGAATPCVITDCNATVAATEVLPAVQAFCAAVSASATVVKSTATSAATSVASTVAVSTTSAVVETTSAAASSGGYGATTLTTSAAHHYSTSAPTNATSTKSSPTTVVTAGAAMATAGSVGMLLLGALAAL